MIILILSLVNVVSTLLSIVVLSFLYFQHSSRIEGIQYWILCHGLNMAAFAFTASRAVLPEWIAIMFANPLFALSFIALYAGMGKFFNLKVNLKPYIALLVLFVPVLAYYTFVEDNLNMRQFFLYAFLVVINLRIAYFLLKNRSKDVHGISTFGAFTLFAIAFFFAVSMGIILSEQSIHQFFDGNPRDTMIMSTTIFTTILMTYSEIMLISARLLENVRISERKFSLVFDNSLLPVFISRLSDSKIYEVNSSFERLFGYTAKEILGKTTLDINLWEDPDQRQYIINQLNKEVKVKDMEAAFIAKDGKRLICQISCNLVRIQGEDYVLNDVYDVTDSVNLREDLKRLATQDHLTGLANRALFMTVSNKPDLRPSVTGIRFPSS
jgi:PAS domain S-box-containing protein